MSEKENFDFNEDHEYQSDYLPFTCDECNKPTDVYYKYGTWVSFPKIICWRCRLCLEKERRFSK